MSTTIRVSDGTRDRYARLAAQTGRPMSQLLEEAADALERRLFFEQLSARYTALREDREQWQAVERERDAESGALADRSE